MTKPTRLLCLAAAALISACGSDAGTGPTATTTVDLATALGEMSVPGLTAMGSVAGGISTPSVGIVTSGCTYVAASQNFACPTVTQNGLTITATYSLLNASGQSLSQFDANTVSALRVKSTIAGNLSVSNETFTVDGQQDQTLSGLQGTTHTLNGTSTFNMSGTRTGAPLPGPFSARSTTTITNVVLPARGSSNSYPSSGSIALDQVMSAAGTSMTSRVVLTFNGTSKVAVTLTVEGRTLSGCTIDLSSATPSCG